MVAPGLVGPDHAAALKATVLPPSYPTAGGTDLRAALTSQSALLRAFQPTAPLAPDGKRVLVVMTDGTPGDCGPGRNACVDDVAALVTGEPAISTFVIGIGDVDDAEASVYDEKFLSRLANAGGAAPAGCNPDWDGQNPQGTQPCHFQVTPGAKTSDMIRDEMIAAFNQIASRVQSCELTLDQTSPIDPTKVNVVYTDASGETQVLPGAEGWTYDDPAAPTKVILGGASCERLKADPDATVRIVIGCPTGTAVVN
ncbi:VWA domain-containing protein [bacterium]|nr:MAG: VWA domain-containing protein [bacterium]